MPFGLSPRAVFIIEALAVIISLSAMIIGLTFGLETPPLEDGGSPPCNPNGPFIPECPESVTASEKHGNGFDHAQMFFEIANSLGARQ